MRRAARVCLALLPLLPGAVAASPTRVASLNLCSDEYALLLARPGQLVSISRLGADPRETPLADRARGLVTNRGRVTDVVALRPDLIVTSNGDPNAAATARRLGIPTVELPQPRTLADISANIRTVAAALDQGARGAALATAVQAGFGTAPRRRQAALLVAGGGFVAGANGIAAEALRHAGLAAQPVRRGRVSLEALLLRPPAVLLTSRYHPGEASANQAWLAHPALAALPPRVMRLATDGRRWTCMGPTLAPEIARLRQALHR